MTRSANQNGDIPWTQYEPKNQRTRNSSLASIASFASVASISSIASKVSNFWRPTARDVQRRQSVPVVTRERYVHVPQHAAADHIKTTTVVPPRTRQASISPASPRGRQASMYPPVPRTRQASMVPS